MLYSCTLTTKCAPKIKEIPFPFPASWTSSVISSSSSQASSFLWAHSHIWKFATWRFICRGLTVPCSRHFEEVQTLPEGANTHRHLCYSFLSDAWLWVYYTVGQAQAVVQDWIFPGISYDPEIHGVCVWGGGGGGLQGLFAFGWLHWLEFWGSRNFAKYFTNMLVLLCPSLCTCPNPYLQIPHLSRQAMQNQCLGAVAPNLYCSSKSAAIQRYQYLSSLLSITSTPSLPATLLPCPTWFPLNT